MAPDKRRSARPRSRHVALAAFAAIAVLGGCGEGGLANAQEVEIGCAERDELEPYWVTIGAGGLDDHEGMTAVIVAEMRLSFEQTTCRSRAAVAIADGRLDVVMEGRSDGAAYPYLHVYIDRHDTGQCDVDEDPAWHVVASVPPGDSITFELDDDDFDDSSPDRCEPFARL
jgi:hypothetical protein